MVPLVYEFMRLPPVYGLFDNVITYVLFEGRRSVDLDGGHREGRPDALITLPETVFFNRSSIFLVFPS